MLDTYQSTIDVIARVLLGLAIFTGAVCLLDWAIRTRRINPFNPISRFFRRWVDPMMRPLENVIVRRGGQPQQAPFFAFMAIIITGIILIQLLRVGGDLLGQIAIGMTGPRQFVLLLLSWALRFVGFALLVRVISTWLPISPYSRWIRWSYVSTEWLLAPLRRVVPAFGTFDITPIVAYLLLMVVGSILGLR